jgi:hypothetical protein
MYHSEALLTLKDASLNLLNHVRFCLKIPQYSNLRMPAQFFQAGLVLSPKHSKSHVFQRLAILIHRANASSILARAPALPPPHILGY